MTNIIHGGFIVKAVRLFGGTKCQFGPFHQREKADEVMGDMTRLCEYSHIWIELNKTSPVLENQEVESAVKY